MRPSHPADRYPFLEKSSLRGLAYVMRRYPLWPNSFNWDYDAGHWNTLNLLNCLWPGPPGWHPEADFYWDSLTGRLSNISRADCQRLILSWRAAAYRIGGVPVWRRRPERVTEHLLASRIEEYLYDKPEVGWPRGNVRPEELYIHRPGKIAEGYRWEPST